MPTFRPGPGPQLSHAAILGPRRSAHLARAALARRRPQALHSQDFCELLWVQNGRLRLHGPAGWLDLAEGALVFLRPADPHGLQGLSDDTLAVSVTLHPGLVAGLATRHPTLAGRLFWSSGEAPEVVLLDSRALAQLNQAALRFERSEGDALAAEALILPLLAQIAGDRLDLPSEAPEWLRVSCAAAQDPAVFRDGAAGLARVAGRAHPHVSRTMRRLLGMSPTEYINARRMDFAAIRLVGSTDSLAEIAADCGLPNLSHFHKLFRARHGLTPAAYRRSRQQDLFQP